MDRVFLVEPEPWNEEDPRGCPGGLSVGVWGSLCGAGAEVVVFEAVAVAL